MKTEILQQKLQRYITGQASPAESRQIQNWLSCTTQLEGLKPEQRSALEMDILLEIQAYTAYPLYRREKEGSWWRKITAMF